MDLQWARRNLPLISAKSHGPYNAVATKRGQMARKLEFGAPVALYGGLLFDRRIDSGSQQIRVII